MPKIIDHEKRKRNIVLSAVKLFARQGYQTTNFTQIAQECGFSRPTLYLYFQDKEELFQFAIKFYTDLMYSDYKDIAENTSNSALERLLETISRFLKACRRQNDFLTTLFDFLLYMKRDGADVNELIYRRTFKFRYMLMRLIRQGISQGEFDVDDIAKAADHIYLMLKAFVVQMTFLSEFSIEDTLDVFRTVLNSFEKTE